MRVPGIHHISAICGDPRPNVDFYTGLLGLRLVKRTVNYDDPYTWHLYYGDGLGTPGTIITFFAWVLPPLVSGTGRPGTGQVVAVPFRIPAASLDFWIDRLAAAAVDFEGPETRFGEPVLALRDPDGIPLELIARGAGEPQAVWSDSPVPTPHAIRGFAGATLCLDGHARTAALLTETLGLRETGNEGSRFRYRSGEGADGVAIDLVCQPEAGPGRMGIGAVHHLAWRAPSDAAQHEWRQVLAAAGLDVTPILDRGYFRSVYFREPGGVLLEIATDAPGFTVDEPPDELGRSLRLPAWLEPRRERIEARLPGIRSRAAAS